MTKENRRRLALYPLALVLLCGLVYGGFIYEAEPSAGMLIGAAEFLAGAGKFGCEKSIEMLDRALLQEPDNRYAHILLGYCYGVLEDYERSEAAYRRALDLSDPDDPQRGLLRLCLAELLQKAGRTEDALAEASSVTTDPVHGGKAWLMVGACRLSLGESEAGREAYRRSFDSDPRSSRALLLLAELDESDGAPDAARAVLESAALLFPLDTDVLLARARLRLATGDRDGAVEDVLAVAEMWPEIAREGLEGEGALSALSEDPSVKASLDVQKRFDFPLKYISTESR